MVQLTSSVSSHCTCQVELSSHAILEDQLEPGLGIGWDRWKLQDFWGMTWRAWSSNLRQAKKSPPSRHLVLSCLKSVDGSQDFIQFSPYLQQAARHFYWTDMGERWFEQYVSHLWRFPLVWNLQVSHLWSYLLILVITPDFLFMFFCFRLLPHEGPCPRSPRSVYGSSGTLFFFWGGSSQNERTSTATRMALFQDSKQPKRLCGPKKALERRPKPSRGCTQQRKYKMHLDYQPWKNESFIRPWKERPCGQNMTEFWNWINHNLRPFKSLRSTTENPNKMRTLWAFFHVFSLLSRKIITVSTGNLSLPVC